jgi:hypothetical protein
MCHGSGTLVHAVFFPVLSPVLSPVFSLSPVLSPILSPIHSLSPVLSRVLFPFPCLVSCFFPFLLSCLLFFPLFFHFSFLVSCSFTVFPLTFSPVPFYPCPNLVTLPLKKPRVKEKILMKPKVRVGGVHKNTRYGPAYTPYLLVASKTFMHLGRIVKPNRFLAPEKCRMQLSSLLPAGRNFGRGTQWKKGVTCLKIKRHVFVLFFLLEST